MIYENSIIFKKLLRSDRKEKFHHKNIIKSIIFRKFNDFFFSSDTTDNIISSPKIIEKFLFPETCFIARQLF